MINMAERLLILMRLKPIAVLITVLLLAGCIQPEVTEVKRKWGEVNEEYSEILVDIGINNPLPFLPLKDVESSIYINGIQIATGNAKDIERDRIVLGIKIDNSRIRDFWISHLSNNEKSSVITKAVPVINLLVTEYRYPVELEQNIETRVFEMSFGDKKLEVAGKEVFAFKEIIAERGKVDNQKTEILIKGKTINSAPVRIDVESLEYEIYFNEVLMGKGMVELNVILKSKESSEISIPAIIENSKIPQWWVSHIKNGEVTNVKVNGKLKVNMAGAIYTISFENSKAFTTNLAD